MRAGPAGTGPTSGAIQRGGRRFAPPSTTAVNANLVDAAIADPLSPGNVSPAILGIGPVTGFMPVRLDLAVRKSGRTTGVTDGTVIATAASLRVNYGNRGMARFRSQILTTPMAAGGDSGSLLVDGAGRAVGLLFAGSDLATVFNPILPVLRAFRVSFSASQSPDTAEAEAQAAWHATLAAAPGGASLQAAVTDHQEGLLKLLNVVGVGSGWKRVAGLSTGHPALVVMVRRKVPPDQLPPGHLVPPALQRWPTDVVETGEFLAFQRRVRPAPPGVSIGHFRGATGTLGAVVYDAFRRPAILSNNHILANATNGRDGRAARGDSILQPGRADGGTAPGDTIARLRSFVPLGFLG